NESHSGVETSLISSSLTFSQTSRSISIQRKPAKAAMAYSGFVFSQAHSSSRCTCSAAINAAQDGSVTTVAGTATVTFTNQFSGSDCRSRVNHSCNFGKLPALGTHYVRPLHAGYCVGRYGHLLSPARGSGGSQYARPEYS